MSPRRGWSNALLPIRCLALLAALAATEAAQATALVGQIPGGGSLPGYSGACSSDSPEVAMAQCQYTVGLSPFNGGFAYRYDFTLTVPNSQSSANWTLGAIELPLFSAAAVLPGSVTLTHWASNNGWSATVVNQGDAGWDWGFADPGGPKASWGDVTSVLKVATLDAVNDVPISEAIGFSFYSDYAPVSGPYQLTLSSDPADPAASFTAFIDPPVPGAPVVNSVPEPTTLALAMFCLLAPAWRRGMRKG